jgi:Na+/serine symporter
VAGVVFLAGSLAGESLLAVPFVDGSLFGVSDDVDVERLSFR